MHAMPGAAAVGAGGWHAAPAIAPHARRAAHATRRRSITGEIELLRQFQDAGSIVGPAVLTPAGVQLESWGENSGWALWLGVTVAEGKWGATPFPSHEASTVPSRRVVRLKLCVCGRPGLPPPTPPAPHLPRHAVLLQGRLPAFKRQPFSIRTLCSCSCWQVRCRALAGHAPEGGRRGLPSWRWGLPGLAIPRPPSPHAHAGARADPLEEPAAVHGEEGGAGGRDAGAGTGAAWIARAHVPRPLARRRPPGRGAGPERVPRAWRGWGWAAATRLAALRRMHPPPTAAPGAPAGQAGGLRHRRSQLVGGAASKGPGAAEGEDSAEGCSQQRRRLFWGVLLWNVMAISEGHRLCDVTPRRRFALPFPRTTKRKKATSMAQTSAPRGRRRSCARAPCDCERGGARRRRRPLHGARRLTRLLHAQALALACPRKCCVITRRVCGPGRGEGLG